MSATRTTLLRTATGGQACQLLAAIAERLGPGLELVPGRRRSCSARTRTAGGTSARSSISSATPRADLAKGPRGYFTASPGHQRHGEESERQADQGLAPRPAQWHGPAGLAKEIDPQVQGWINYCGAFYRSELCSLAWRINEHLVPWAMHERAIPRRVRQNDGLAAEGVSVPAWPVAHGHSSRSPKAGLWGPDDGRLHVRS